MGVLIRLFIQLIVFTLLLSCQGNREVNNIDFDLWEKEVFSYNNFFYKNKLFHSSACDSVPPSGPDFYKGKPYYTYEEWMEIHLKNRIKILKAIDIRPGSLITEYYEGKLFDIYIQNTDSTVMVVKGTNTFFDGFKIKEINVKKTDSTIPKIIHSMGEKVNYYEETPMCQIDKINITTYYDGKYLIVLQVYI